MPLPIARAPAGSSGEGGRSLLRLGAGGSSGSAGVGGGPAFGVVFEEDGFDEFADECWFVGVEVLGGFEGEGEVV